MRILLLGRRHRDRLLLEDRVERTVKHGVDAEREEVLVVGCQNSRRHHITPVGCLAWVNERGGKDARSTRLHFDVAVLPEEPGKDVLVVADGEDGLEDEVSGPSNTNALCAVVRVLPTNATVLLMEADHVAGVDRVALVIVEPASEVLDRTEAVTAKREVVGCTAGSGISEIKGLLSVVRASWIYESLSAILPMSISSRMLVCGTYLHTAQSSH